MSTPFDTLKQLRREYPTPLNDPAKAVELLNRVAYLHRADGWGLYSASPSQFGAKRYDGKKCKADILCQKTGSHFDALKDGEGEAAPVWREVGPTDPARFVAPIQPIQVDPQPEPEPVPNPGANVPNSGTCDCAARLAGLEAKIDQLLNDTPIVVAVGPMSGYVDLGWLGGKRPVELIPKDDQ